MIKILIKKFIADYDDTDNKDVRQKYGILAGVLGMICNLLLVAVKLISGFAMNSIAIISDGLNNLSDMGSSLVTVIGAKLSAKRPDSDHPFGHGRFEYISALIVSFIIIYMGVETFIGSVKKVIEPQKVIFNPYIIILLVLSCFVKLWMYSYNKYMGKRIDSVMLKAAASDSLNDVFATGAVVAATVLGIFLKRFPMDGVLGVVVSVLILKSGFDIAKDTIAKLLGQPPSAEIVKKIRDIIMSGEGIIGVHDLIVHDYGPGRIIASAHAEVPDDENITRIHEIIDSLERKICDELGIIMVLHMDPIAVNCPKTNQLKGMVVKIIGEINPDITMHDFRITDGQDNINLIFDIVVPSGYSEEEINEIRERISSTVKAQNEQCSTVINVDEL